MARGWESKSVEAQQEDAIRPVPKGPVATGAELVRQEHRKALELTRRRAAADLARASAPAHRKMLAQAIASLDAQLATINEQP